MTQVQKAEMQANILRHGEQLNAIFNTGLDPVKLCKRLRTLEMQATHYTTLECNTGKDYSVELSKILTQVKKVLFPDTFNSNKELYLAVYINGDPRGYALKIKDSYVREHNLQIHSDWGGYGILAPDYTFTG